MIKNLLFFFIVAISFFSCKNKKERDTSFTYFGGEIVNPKSDFVVLFKGEQFLDSLKLDANNHFYCQIQDLEEGLYSFSHQEYQVFYLKPLDSLMVRVNTIDFDESLSYTGIGSERNNFLMDMFLINEEEIELMPSLYKLSPLKFEKALDSLKSIRTKNYQDFIERDEPNEAFKEVAEASINYDYYSKKEIYITANERKRGKDNYFTIPKSFYSYRKNIDFGNETLHSYFPYYRFLFRYFDNLALEKNKNTDYYSRNSFNHSYKKIELIDQIITNDSLKYNMVKNITGRYLLGCNKRDNQEKMLALFLKVDANKKHQEDIIRVANASMKLTPGNKVSNLSLVTPENTLKNLLTIIHNPTVLYFWSNKSVSHYKNIHYRVTELNKIFPEYDFIGINTDTQFEKWKAILSKNKYQTSREYQFENLLKAEKELVIYTVNKAIIVDKNGVIVNGSTNLFNANIESILLGYLNQ